MRKAHITLYVLLGLSLIIILSLFFFYTQSRLLNARDYSQDEQYFVRYFDDCNKGVLPLANKRFGLSAMNEQGYLLYYSDELEKCMGYYFSDIKNKGFSVTGGKVESIYRQLNDKNVIIDIHYPSTIKKRSYSFGFDEYVITWQLEAQYAYPEKNIISTDTSFKAVFKGEPSLFFYNKTSPEKVFVKSIDKWDYYSPILKSNLIYAVLPDYLYTEEGFEVTIDLKGTGLEEDKSLKIGWLESNSGKWGYLPTSNSNGTLKAVAKHTGYFAVIQPGEIPVITNNEEPPSENIIGYGEYDDAYTGPISTYKGTDYSIFSSIKKEMYSHYGVPDKGYTLTMNPACVQDLLPGVYCITGFRCGILGVHCNPSLLAPSGEALKNQLFRHELVHSIQQINNAPYDRIKAEWGAEHLSGSSYYSFLLNGARVSARAISEKMKSNGCTEQEITDAALGRPAREQIWNKCLTSKGNHVSW